MKKILFAIFGLFCLFSLVGCGDKKKEDEKQPEEDELTKYDLELKEHLDSTIPDLVTENIDLIKYYDYEDGYSASIKWASSNERTITTKGRYAQNLFEEEITLTATVTYDTGLKDYIYTKKVRTEGSEDLNAYKKIIESYIPDYLYKDYELITRDQTFKKYNLFGTISYKSADESIVKIVEETYEDGKTDVTKTYTKYVNTLKDNQEVDINYNVAINGINVKGVKKITVEGRDDIKYINEAKNFLDGYFTTDKIYNKIELPYTDENERVNITWTSSRPTIVSNECKLYTFEPNIDFTMTATIDYNGTIETWEKELHSYKEDELVDFVLNRLHKDVVQQYVMRLYGSQSYNADNFGFIPFYYQDLDMQDIVTSTTPNNEQINYYETSTKNKNIQNIIMQTGLMDWNGPGRPKEKKTSTDVIVVHDTATTTTSAEDWNEIEQHSEKRQASWNFTVGDKKIFQHIPIEEVAWHAGDGGEVDFKLLDTGVKFDGYDPVITLGKDHYFHFNGKTSNIRIPIDPKTHEDAEKISDSGLYTCIGKNGNYFMAEVYYNSSYGRISTKGGNKNGIGIETDVSMGVDYNQVMRNCANLVGNLLVYFDLPSDRIIQHRHCSGKLCPQTMIRNGLWDEFFSLCQTEYLIKKYLKDLKIEYTTSDETLLSKTGKVLKEVTEDTTVKYTVKTTFNGVEKTFNFETTIKPIVRDK